MSIDGHSAWGELVDPDDWSKGKYYPLHQYQSQIYNWDGRFCAAIAGTGGGKTVLGALWCVKQIQRAIQKYGKCLGMIIAPTYKVLSRATAPTFVDTVNYTALGPQAGGRYLPSNSYYELPGNLGKIWMQGADNPGGLEGGQFDFVWADEGGQCGNKVFNAIMGRTGAKMAPILVTTTPYVGNDGFGPLHKQWMPAFEAGDKDYKIVQFPSISNPCYPVEEFERARKLLTPEVFQQRYMGLFTAVEGQVYPRFYKCKIKMRPSEIALLLKSPGKFYGGIDFGWNDPFCALNGFLSMNQDFGWDVLYLWYERYKSMTVIEEHAKKLPKIKDKEVTWWADHSPELIKKLRRAGHNVKRAKKRFAAAGKSSIQARIQLVNARIYSEHIKVLENRCPACCAEAESYVYPEKDEEIIGDVPIDRDNHAMDAMGYLVTGIDSKKAAM